MTAQDRFDSDVSYFWAILDGKENGMTNINDYRITFSGEEVANGIANISRILSGNPAISRSRFPTRAKCKKLSKFGQKKRRKI